MWRWHLLSFLVGNSWVFLPAVSLLMGGIAGLGKIVIMGPQEPVKICLSLRFKSHWLSEIGVLGTCHSGRNLKSWVTKCKGPSLLWEMLRIVISLLTVSCCAGCGVYGKTVLALYLLWCEFFSFAQHTRVTRLLSGFLSDGIVLYEAEVLVYPCEEMYRSLLWGQLELEPGWQFLDERKFILILESIQVRNMSNPKIT